MIKLFYSFNYYLYHSLYTGVLISSGSRPELRRNRVFGGKAAGIEVTNGGSGMIEENEVFDNQYDGICLATGVCPILKSKFVTRVHVHNNIMSGD